MRLVAAVVLLSCACVAGPPEVGQEEGVAEIEGEATCEHPGIGYLGASGCTGTLVSPSVVLTAAHCFDYGSGDEPGRFRVDLCGGGSITRNVDRHRSLPFSITLPIGHADLALVHLTQPLYDVPTLPIATSSPWPLEWVTAWGYGGVDLDNTASGIKRMAEVRWNLSWAAHPGDSGGPWLDDDEAIVGTTSWGARKGIPVTDETGRPVRHREELMRRIGGMERSGSLTCSDWADAAGYGLGACLPSARGRGCVETDDCGHCCDLLPGITTASSLSCSLWGWWAGWENPTCDEDGEGACGGTGPETDDCAHCCDLGDDD